MHYPDSDESIVSESSPITQYEDELFGYYESLSLLLDRAISRADQIQATADATLSVVEVGIPDRAVRQQFRDRCLATTATTLLELTSTKDLDWIPWELLGNLVHNENGDHHSYAWRLIKKERQAKRRRIHTPGLFMAQSDPLNAIPPNTRLEFAEIEQCLRHRVDRDEIRLGKLSSAKFPNLHVMLQESEPTVLHLAVHGHDNELTFQFSDRVHRVSYEEFVKYLRPLESISVVVLSVCNSARSAKGQASLARRLVEEAHIPMVIGMAVEITPIAMLAFTRGFYGGLGSGQSVAEAYAIGVRDIRGLLFSELPSEGEFEEDYLLWSVPMLYGSENVIPFPKNDHVNLQEGLRRAARQIDNARPLLHDFIPQSGTRRWLYQSSALSSVLEDVLDELQSLVQLPLVPQADRVRWALRVSDTRDETERLLKHVILNIHALSAPGMPRVERIRSTRSLAALTPRLVKALDHLWNLLESEYPELLAVGHP